MTTIFAEATTQLAAALGLQIDNDFTGVEVHPHELQATRRYVEQVNQRAQQRGYAGRLELEARVGQVDRVEARGEAVVTFHDPVVRARVGGTAPRLGGWELLARADALDARDTDKPQFVIAAFPGADVDQIDREALRANWCDHCRSRRRRRQTYLVRNTSTGEISQVGTTCLNDYTGWEGRVVTQQRHCVNTGDNDMLEKFLEGHRRTSHDGDWPPVWVLAAAMAVVARNDYQTGTTGHDVRQYLLADGYKAAEGALQRAQDIIDELLADDSPSGYSSNLKAALSAEYVNSRTVGLICSAIPAYKRLQRRQASPLKWIGTLGERITVSGNITSNEADRTTFGRKEIIRRRVTVDGPDFRLRFTTTAAWAYRPDAIGPITLTGTVTDHTTHNDEPVTTINRPKKITA